MSARTTACSPITSRSSLRIDPVKFPSMRSMPLICISSKAARILIAAVVFACLFTAVLALISPHFRVNDSDRARLAAENQMLKIENTNLTFKIRRLDDQVGRMEEGSQRVVTLMQTE